MSTEANKALVRRFYEEIDKGNLAAMDELVAEDYIDHSPPPFPGLSSGRAGLKQAFEIFWVATPGQHHIEEQIAEGDKVVTRIRVTGTHEDDLPGISEDREQAGDDGDGDPQDRSWEARREVVKQGRAWLSPATRRHPSARRSRLLSVGSRRASAPGAE